MILAAVEAHANCLYHEWGLVGAVLGACVVLLPALWWLGSMKSHVATAAVLEIRSGLSSLFRETVVGEALRICQLVDDHLPSALSQVDDLNPKPSAFDELCRGLRELDDEQPDRQLYAALLKNALGGVMIGEVRRHLMMAGAESGGAAGGQGSRTGLRVAFEGDTELKLTFIAKKIALASRKERLFYCSKRWALRLFGISGVTGFLVCAVVLVDHLWAYRVGLVLLSAFFLAGAAGVFALLLLLRSQGWLEETAKRHRTPEDWKRELAQQRG